jgi:hypothetical protein
VKIFKNKSLWHFGVGLLGLFKEFNGNGLGLSGKPMEGVMRNNS